MKTVQCPNCGAAATNFKNCEFCGSLFVRLVENNIDTKNLFIENNFNGFVFPNLEEFLEQNIKLQKILPGHFIVTDIIYNNEVCLQIVASNKIQYLLKNEIVSEIGLAIHIPFNSKNSPEFKRFLKFDENILFNHTSDNGFEDYAIDYGSDIKGAAYLSSKLIKEVFLIPSSAQLEFKTSDYDEVPTQPTNSSNCFIATATMGSYDHPVVVDLREFRDTWLLTKNWGITFVNWYYTNGPKAARIIKKSYLAKKLCYYLIIKPIHYLTKIKK